MLLISQILVRTFVLGAVTVALLACGQQGALYLPTSPGAIHRASLPEALLPGLKTTPASATSPVSQPIATP